MTATSSAEAANPAAVPANSAEDGISSKSNAASIGDATASKS